MPGARWLVALAFVGLLVVGCTQQEGAAVIGVPAQPTISPAPAAIDQSSIEAGLTAQVAESTKAAAVPQGPLAPGQLPLDTLLTFKEQLRWASVETTALAYIDSDLAAIAQLRNRVAADGSSTSSLDTATFELTQLRATIAADQLVYQARADLHRFWILHVRAQVLTANREILSAHQLSTLAAIYASAEAPMPQEVLIAQCAGVDYTALQADITDLTAMIQAMRYDSSAILADVQSGLYKNAHGFQQAGLAASAAARSDIGRARAEIAYLEPQEAPCS